MESYRNVPYSEKLGIRYKKSLYIASRVSYKLKTGGPVRVQSVGDSRMAGYTSLSINVFSTVFSEMIRLSEGLLMSAGVSRESETNPGTTSYSGWTSDEVVASVFANPRTEYADVFMCHFGVNDRTGTAEWTLAELENIKRNYRIMADYTLDNGIAMWVCAELLDEITSVTASNTSNTTQLEAFNNWLACFCERYPHITFIPLHQVLNDATYGGLNGDYTNDTLHLNSLGAYVAGSFALATVKGEPTGVFPYLATSNQCAFTTTNPDIGAPLNLAGGNLTAVSATTGYTTLGGGTISAVDYDSGSYGLGRWINFLKTSSGTRYVYAELATPTAGFFESGDRLLIACRAAIVDDNVAVELALERNNGAEVGLPISNVTTSVHGDVLAYTAIPTATPTRYRLMFTMFDKTTFADPQNVRMGQPTIINWTKLNASVDNHAEFPLGMAV